MGALEAHGFGAGLGKNGTVASMSAVDDASLWDRAWNQRWLIAGFIVVLGVVGALTVSHGIAGDYLWSLANGKWMLAHGEVMKHDPWSYALHGGPIIVNEWGYELALALAVKYLGYGGTLLMTVGVGVAASMSTVWYARLMGARGGRLVWIALFIGLFSMGFIGQGRALGLSLVFLPIELGLLALGREKSVWRWALLPLFVVWTNVHGSVLLGIGILGLEFLLALAPSDKFSWLMNRSSDPLAIVWVGIASVAACCVSPWGPGILLKDLYVTTSPQISGLISEWLSPDFRDPFLLLAVLAAVGALAWSAYRRKVSALELVLALVLLVMTLRAVRFLAYLNVATVGLIASEARKFIPDDFARKILVWAGGTALVVLVWGLALSPVNGPANETTAPAGSFAYLSHAAAGRVFSPPDWGGYSIAHGFGTYMDGRTDLFTSNGVAKQAISAIRLSANPEPFFAKEHIRYVVAQRGTPIDTFLETTSGWKLVHRDHYGDVFERLSTSGKSKRSAGARG